MKEKLFYLTLLIVSILFYSCNDDDFEHEDRFNKSHKAWLDFKTQSSDSYQYKAVDGSWVGINWETTITVFEGKVSQRSYKLYKRNSETNKIDLIEEWTENEKELNTHKGGAATLTIDEIYDKAKNEWLIKRKDAKVIFEAQNNGLISNCGYIPDGCADDCFRGINIKDIEALK